DEGNLASLVEEGFDGRSPDPRTAPGDEDARPVQPGMSREAREIHAAGLSVGFARNLGPACANEEIEVAALVRLHDMLDVEALVSAAGKRRRGPRGQATANFLVVDQEIQSARRHVEFDHVA